jgi:hypothetical protein
MNNKKLSEEFIREHADKVDWYRISIYQQLSESLIRDYADKLTWITISRCQKLSESLIRDYADKVNWDCISVFQNLSEDFIREHADRVNWDDISEYQRLGEEFIREHADKVCWMNVSIYQNLSEDFIMEFEDKVVWGYILEYQNLSDEFINNIKRVRPILNDIKEYFKEVYHISDVNLDITFQADNLIEVNGKLYICFGSREEVASYVKSMIRMFYNVKEEDIVESEFKISGTKGYLGRGYRLKSGGYLYEY